MKKITAEFCKLIRLPNLFTLPGDILCGFILAVWYPAYILKSGLSAEMSLFTLILISLATYSFGLIQNDLFGLEEDRAAGRTKRPLVSGTISVNTAKSLCILLLLLSIGISFLVNLTTVVIVLFIVILSTIYNRSAHNNPLLSAPVMGLCRGLNVMLGASACGVDIFTLERLNFPLLCCAIFHTLYITSVTLFAAREQTKAPTRMVTFLPFITILALTVVIHHIGFIILSVLVLLTVISINERSTPKTIGAATGQLISLLIISQICWIIAVTNDQLTAIPIALCYLTNRILSKTFYSS